MVVDLSTVVDGLAGLMMAAITTSIPILVPVLLRKLHLENNEVMVQALTGAATRAAGMVKTSIDANKNSLSQVTIKDAAIAEQVQRLVAKYPEYTMALGVSQDTVRDMIAGELGKLTAGHTVVVTPGAGAPVS